MVNQKLLSLIACHDGGESCVCDLLDAFDMTAPSVSYGPGPAVGHERHWTPPSLTTPACRRR